MHCKASTTARLVTAVRGDRKLQHARSRGREESRTHSAVTCQGSSCTWLTMVTSREALRGVSAHSTKPAVSLPPSRAPGLPPSPAPLRALPALPPQVKVGAAPTAAPERAGHEGGDVPAWLCSVTRMIMPRRLGAHGRRGSAPYLGPTTHDPDASALGS